MMLRRSRVVGFASLILLVCTLGVATGLFYPTHASTNFMQQPHFGWSYLRGYRGGLAAAAHDLADDKAVVIGYGEGSLYQERKSGLATLSLGCVADRGVIEYCDGYNLLVDRYVTWKGLP